MALIALITVRQHGKSRADKMTVVEHLISKTIDRSGLVLYYRLHRSLCLFGGELTQILTLACIKTAGTRANDILWIYVFNWLISL